jgi:pimeloyl-ACP methyl ester carboxylesterase
LLLVHGAGGNLATMTTLAHALSSAHRVVTVDLRGHGRSGDAPWDWDAVLDDLAVVVDVLGLVRPAVVGMSLGGMAATTGRLTGS